MANQPKTEKGRRTQAAILQTAVDIASVEGLGGLTIGRLAYELQMSKSGLFGHFGSKEGLQLATIEAARQIFVDEVIIPSRQVEHGMNRIWALCDAWLSYMEREVFSGGCFFVTAATEFDNRPGEVKDAVAANMQEWLSYLEYIVQRAVEIGHLEPDARPKQLAFELHALYMGANWALQLFDDQHATNRARAAILTRLQAVKTTIAPKLPEIEIDA